MRGLVLLASLWLASGSPALAQKSLPPMTDQLLVEIDEMVEKEIVALFVATDPIEPGWSEQGVDLDKLLEGEPQRALFSPDDDGPSIIMMENQVDAWLPQTWYPVKSTKHGSVPADANEAAIFRVTPYHLIGVRGGSRKVGKAKCTNPNLGVELIFFERDGAAKAKYQELGSFMTYFFDRYMERFTKLDICSIVRETSPGRFRTSTYTSDGRPLKELNEEAQDERLISKAEVVAALGISD